MKLNASNLRQSLEEGGKFQTGGQVPPAWAPIHVSQHISPVSIGSGSARIPPAPLLCVGAERATAVLGHKKINN